MEYELCDVHLRFDSVTGGCSTLLLRKPFPPNRSVTRFICRSNFRSNFPCCECWRRRRRVHVTPIITEHAHKLPKTCIPHSAHTLVSMFEKVELRGSTEFDVRSSNHKHTRARQLRDYLCVSRKSFRMFPVPFSRSHQAAQSAHIHRKTQTATISVADAGGSDGEENFSSKARIKVFSFLWGFRLAVASRVKNILCLRWMAV